QNFKWSNIGKLGINNYPDHLFVFNVNINVMFSIVIDCGPPPSVLHAEQLSPTITHYRDTKVGSSVSYKCTEGFYNVREGDSSVCDSEGIWSHPDFLCQGIFLCFFYLFDIFSLFIL
uniref:Sushi domain-containing protein n=1 Tax=Cyprinus carpio TaxID=7962 RepID=A0A8C1ZXS1_CYPCA